MARAKLGAQASLATGSSVSFLTLALLPGAGHQDTLPVTIAVIRTSRYVTKSPRPSKRTLAVICKLKMGQGSTAKPPKAAGTKY